MLPRETVAEPIVVVPAQTRAAPAEPQRAVQPCRRRRRRARSAGAVLRQSDPAGERLQIPRGEPGRRAGHRAVHAARRARLWPGKSVRSAALAVGVGQIPARAARPVRQPRSRRRRLQRRSQARAGLDGEARQAARGDPQLRAQHHRPAGRALGARQAPDRRKRLPAHARCPGMPAIEVSVPEAAPVKVAKNAKGKGTKLASKLARRNRRRPSRRSQGRRRVGRNCRSSRRQGGRAEARSASRSRWRRPQPGKKIVVIKNGKIQIMAAEKSSKKPAAPRSPSRKRSPLQSAAKRQPKPQPKLQRRRRSEPAKVETKVAVASAPKGAAKAVAKSQSKQPAGKRVKVAAVR